MNQFPVTEKNKLVRSPSRGIYEQAKIYEILDAGFVCQVAFVHNSDPFIIPMSYGRKGNFLYLHGASSSRIMKMLSENPAICISVTLLDGIVLARSVFDTSVNYRSVVIFGSAEVIREEEKTIALHAISEHIIPGRWEEARPPAPNELKATTILKVNIQQVSGKVRSGPPDDDPKDLNLPVWAGVVPLKLQAGDPINDPVLIGDHPIPASAQALLKTYS